MAHLGLDRDRLVQAIDVALDGLLTVYVLLEGPMDDQPPLEALDAALEQSPRYASAMGAWLEAQREVHRILGPAHQELAERLSAAAVDMSVATAAVGFSLGVAGRAARP